MRQRRGIPVIDYLACVECGTCVAKCPHGVFDTAKALSPIVKNPESCVDYCHSWGNRCVGTDNVLDEVMMTLTPAIQLAGYEVKYNKIKMETAEFATQYQFLSSPTIRVNS